MYVRFFILISLSVFSLSASARSLREFVPEILPGSRPVVVGKTTKHPQTHSKLRIARVENLHTDLLYSQYGFVFPTQKAVIIALPGSGGKAEDYGVEASIAKLASGMLKKGINVIGAELPLYYGHDIPGFNRDKIINYYQDLNHFLDWDYALTEMIVSKVREMEDTYDLPRVPIIAVGRSTGSAIWSEAEHRYIIGDPRAAAMKEISSINVWGINGHTPEDMERWIAREKEFDLEHGGLEHRDVEVTLASEELFKQMTWQTGERPKELSEANLIPPPEHSIPSVYAIVSKGDVFSSSADQIRIMKDFANHHPTMRTKVIGTDTKHDPSAQVEYDDLNGVHRKVETMERVKPILLEQLEVQHPPVGFNFIQILIMSTRLIAVAPPF